MQKISTALVLITCATMVSVVAQQSFSGRLSAAGSLRSPAHRKATPSSYHKSKRLRRTFTSDEGLEQVGARLSLD